MISQLPESLNVLQSYNQFILCKLVPKPNGKNDKLPFNPETGKVSNAHDSSIWMSAEKAIHYMNAQPGTLLGFAFTKDDPFWFLDIDGCIDSSGSYNTLSTELMNMLPGAAIEVSSSGKGLHIFGYGIPPEHACKNIALNIEFYHQERFVAFGFLEQMVGNINLDFTNHLPPLIDKYFPPVTAFNDANWTNTPHHEWSGYEIDEDLIAKATKSRSTGSVFGSKASFKQLWNCDVDKLIEFFPTSEDGKDFDRSSADAALAQHLAFWTGNNCERMETLMRHSALVRDKWDTHKSYLRNTITRAKSLQQKFHQRPITPEEALVQNTPEKNEQKLDETTGNGTHTIGYGLFAESIGYPEIKGNGKPKGTFTNFKTLCRMVGVSCRYNLMTKEEEIIIPNGCFLTDTARNSTYSTMRSLCASSEFPVENLDSYISLLASETPYHPAIEWISSKPWDGVDRFDDLVRTLDCSNPDLTSMLLRKWSINAIRHLYDESPKSSGVLVLQGAQNLGKTRWLMNLVKGNPSLAKEGMTLDPSDKDSLSQAINCWIIELGELDATFSKSDLAHLKSFITRDFDEFRPPYARKANKFVRKTALCGSVNPTDYLRDPTGNRRYWTIAVGSKMRPDYDIDMQQYWAQMKQWKDTDVDVTWLRPNELEMLNIHNEQFTVSTPELELLHKFYDANANKTRNMTVSEILQEIDIDPQQARRWSAPIQEFLKGAKSKRSSKGRIYKMPEPRNPFNKMGR